MKRILIKFWILLFVADSLVHPLLFSVEYVAIQRNLSALEMQLSNEKVHQIGESHAVIVLEDNLRLRGDVYSQNFFSEERDGETVCYTIVDSTQLVDFQKISKQNTNDPFSTENHNFFLKFSKILFIQELVSMVAEIPLFEKKSAQFCFKSSKSESFFTVPTLPPNRITV